jgi:hypothetical protein
MLKGSWGNIVWTTITAAAGLAALAAGLTGWLLMKTTWLERGLLVTAGLVLLYPSLLQDVIGLTLLRLRLCCSTSITDRRADCPLRIEISFAFGSRPTVENQSSNKTSQSLPFTVLELHKFHTHATRP